MRAAGAACGGMRAALGGIIAHLEGSVGGLWLLPWHRWRKSSGGFVVRDRRVGNGETPGRDVAEGVLHTWVAILGCSQ